VHARCASSPQVGEDSNLDPRCWNPRCRLGTDLRRSMSGSNRPHPVDSGTATPVASWSNSYPREESNLGDRFRKSTPRSARRGRSDVRVMLPSETDSQTAGFASSLTPRCPRSVSRRASLGLQRSASTWLAARGVLRYGCCPRLSCLKGRRLRWKSNARVGSSSCSQSMVHEAKEKGSSGAGDRSCTCLLLVTNEALVSTSIAGVSSVGTNRTCLRRFNRAQSCL
jgi:hypothetical protein